MNDASFHRMKSRPTQFWQQMAANENAQTG
jgi:hypothetical protein